LAGAMRPEDRQVPGANPACGRGADCRTVQWIDQRITCADAGIEVGQRWHAPGGATAHGTQHLQPEPQLAQAHRAWMTIHAEQSTSDQMADPRKMPSPGPVHEPKRAN